MQEETPSGANGTIRIVEYFRLALDQLRDLELSVAESRRYIDSSRDSLRLECERKLEETARNIRDEIEKQRRAMEKADREESLAREASSRAVWRVLGKHGEALAVLQWKAVAVAGAAAAVAAIVTQLLIHYFSS